MEKEIILSLKNISKEYPGVQALKDVSIDFYKGEVHAIVGENGAGKSTLIKTICGAITPEEGYITFEGLTYNAMAPHLSRELGIEVIYQELNLVPALSIAENVFLGNEIKTKGMVNFKELIQKTNDIFKAMNIIINPSLKINDLSVAYMQLVEIAKAISKEAKVLIMDEPTAPLSTDEVNILFKLIRNLKDKNITIIYISHRISEIYAIADRITVMRDGSKVITMDTVDISRSELIKYMVGRQMKETYPQRNCEIGEVIFETKNISGNGIHNISFTLRKGEILGIAGLVGAGRTELARLIFGADVIQVGEIFIEGKKVEIENSKKAIDLGIGLVPEDRKRQGLILNQSVSWNVVLPIIKRLSKFGVVLMKKVNKCVKKQNDSLKIKGAAINQIVNYLSGGNQQKVVLAKWIASGSKILFLDEPTRGVDVATKQEIYRIMNELAEQGVGIILISSDMEEILGMPDRLIVLCNGRQAGSVNKENFSQEYVLKLASEFI